MAAESTADVVVGAGIIGLAVAYYLARSGRRVVVFERHAAAQGASVRNFGMIWPIGQPAGPRRARALRSRARWCEVLEASRIWHAPSGSLHLAYREDEAQVLEEFVRGARDERFPCELVLPTAVAERSPRVITEGLRAALWSPNEIVVDPRDVVARLPAWLADRWHVRFHFGTLVHGIDGTLIETSAGQWRAERCFVCTGDELQVLYPAAFASLALRRCKLQMLRTRPVAWRLGPALAAGLTLGHYEAFATCPSLPALKRRFASELPEYVRLGIHVMASQTETGELTLGDSHEYDQAVTPFDNPAIDALVLEYLKGFLNLRDVEIASRWHGVYVKHPTDSFCVVKPARDVTALVGFGGAGMTLSFGAAEEVVA
jgi:FAD dependent oxidoreductase TIGR03364